MCYKLIVVGCWAGLTLALAGGCASGESRVRAPTAAERVELAAALEEMMRLDQLHRTPVSWGTTDPAELARLESLDDDAHIAEWMRRKQEGVALPPELERELMAKQTELDRANFADLVKLTERYGYPDAERLGLDAPDPAAVLIHAQIDDFEAHQDLFYREALAGRMPANSYAVMVDRKLQHQGKVQLYGTSKPFDPTLGQPGPPIIEDITKTNDARAELGMPALETYAIAGE